MTFDTSFGFSALTDVVVLPLRSDTLPPASHTNCVVVGQDVLWIVDPGSAEAAENDRLCDYVRRRQVQSQQVAIGGVVLTHRHRDHVSGAAAVAAALGCDIAAHPVTAEELRGRVNVSRLLNEGDRLPLGSGREAQVLFTPGHARGHICLYLPHSGGLVVGDMLAGLGSVIIAPPDGDVGDYLASLRRLRALNPSVIYPAHGPTIEDACARLDHYIAHRLERERKVRVAIEQGATTLERIVASAYVGTPPELWPWAMRAALAHVAKLVKDGVVSAALSADDELLSDTPITPIT